MGERLSSRLGFIFISAGCAIGLGNVWRFPYVAGANGGGVFVAIYLGFLLVLGVPLLTMEFAAGRAARRSMACLHRELAPRHRAWRLQAGACVLGNALLMMFYTVVTGWMLVYCCRTAAGSFAHQDPAAIADAFHAMLARPGTMALATLAVTTLAALVLAAGVVKGLERMSKWMMGSLLVLIVVLAVRSLSLPGAARGVRFLLSPDLATARSIGWVKVVTAAMNQAFFTLSLGIGAMAVFGGYIGRERRLMGEALNVAALDTFVAVVAGLVIMPATFAYGLEPGQGPALVFVTLPNVFAHMPLGRLWGALFFLFMAFAALTTVLAVFENLLAAIRDWWGLGRLRAALVLALAMPLLAMPCVLGFNRWAAFTPLGPGTNVLDLEDYVVSNLLLPLGALAFALFCTRRWGWGWEAFLAEANAGTAGARFPRWLRVYATWVLPAVVLAVLLLGLK